MKMRTLEHAEVLAFSSVLLSLSPTENSKWQLFSVYICILSSSSLKIALVELIGVYFYSQNYCTHFMHTFFFFAIIKNNNILSSPGKTNTINANRNKLFNFMWEGCKLKIDK